MRLWTKFLIGVLAVFGASAFAAETEPDPVRFEIRRFVLEGNTLLPVATAEPLLAPHQGSNKDFADIQRALEALDAAYRGSVSGSGTVFGLRYNLNCTRFLPGDFQARFQLFEQATKDALVPSEQFGLGGADNVRGFFEREVNNDVDQRVTLKVSSPDLATLLDLKSLRARLAALYDWGHVSHNHPQPGETLGELISSLGIGIRLAASSNYSARIDTARVLQAGADQRRGDWKVHALFSLLLF